MESTHFENKLLVFTCNASVCPVNRNDKYTRNRTRRRKIGGLGKDTEGFGSRRQGEKEGVAGGGLAAVQEFA